MRPRASPTITLGSPIKKVQWRMLCQGSGGEAGDVETEQEDWVQLMARIAQGIVEEKKDEGGLVRLQRLYPDTEDARRAARNCQDAVRGFSEHGKE